MSWWALWLWGIVAVDAVRGLRPEPARQIAGAVAGVATTTALLGLAGLGERADVLAFLVKALGMTPKL